MAQEFRRFDFETPWENFPAHRKELEAEQQNQLPQGDKPEKSWRLTIFIVVLCNLRFCKKVQFTNIGMYVFRLVLHVIC